MKVSEVISHLKIQRAVLKSTFLSKSPSEWIVSDDVKKVGKLGLAVLPKINPLIIPSPKGTSACSYGRNSFIVGFKLATSETKVVLDDQRVQFAKEFDDGIVNAIPGDVQYGVLFSGPNGRMNAR